MQINIVEEVYKLRGGLLEVVNKNPLPTTVKLMIVNELAAALNTVEANEIRQASAKGQAETREDKKEE
jgi:hypothetical protein